MKDTVAFMKKTGSRPLMSGFKDGEWNSSGREEGKQLPIKEETVQATKKNNLRMRLEMTGPKAQYF